MNIYIKMEVRVRELEGRLLLALVAAERGHRVLLGDFRTLLSHRHWLPPGIFHDKALVPSEQRVEHRERLRRAGFVITSQDEEHGLTSDFARFARDRFSAESLGQAATAFAWGPRDAAGLVGAFPSAVGRIVASGSPRVDLWRPEAASFHGARPRMGHEGHILILTNFGVGSANPWWTAVADIRASYRWQEDDGGEWKLYETIADAVRLSGHVVRAVRHAALRRPGLRFVVRPHPVEGIDGWRGLLGDLPNVAVVQSGSVSGWIRAARLVVHNGSTTGFEAAVAGVPVVAYTAGGHNVDLEVNRLGRRAEDPEELVGIIDRSGDPQSRQTWFDGEDQDLLEGTFASLTGRLAAERIVDSWESLPGIEGLEQRVRPRTALIAAASHRATGRVRTTLRGGASRHGTVLRTSHKFPPLQRAEVAALADRFRTAFGRFSGVDVDLVGPRLVRVAPR